MVFGTQWGSRENVFDEKEDSSNALHVDPALKLTKYFCLCSWSFTWTRGGAVQMWKSCA